MKKWLQTSILILLCAYHHAQASSEHDSRIQVDSPDNTWVSIEWQVTHPQWHCRSDLCPVQKVDNVGINLLESYIPGNVNDEPSCNPRAKCHVLFGPYEEFVGVGTLKVFVDFEAFYKSTRGSIADNKLDNSAIYLDLIGEGLVNTARDIKFKHLHRIADEHDFDYLYQLSPNRRSMLVSFVGSRARIPTFSYLSKMHMSILEATGKDPRNVEFRIAVSRDEFDIVIKKVKFLWITKIE